MDSFLGNTRPFFQGLPSSTRGYDGSPDDPTSAPPNPTPPATPTLPPSHAYHPSYHVGAGAGASATTSLPGLLPPSRPITPNTPHKGPEGASAYSLAQFLPPPKTTFSFDSLLKNAGAMPARSNPPDPHALPSVYTSSQSLLDSHYRRSYKTSQSVLPDSRSLARPDTTQAPSLVDTRPSHHYGSVSGIKSDARVSAGRAYATTGSAVYPNHPLTQSLAQDVRSHLENKYLSRNEGRSDLRAHESRGSSRSGSYPYWGHGQPYRTPEAKPLENLAPSVQISTTPNTVNGSKDALYLGRKADDIPRRSDDPYIRSGKNVQVNGSRDPLYPNGSHTYSSSTQRESSLERPTGSQTKEDSALDLSVKTVRQTPDSTAPDPEKTHSPVISNDRLSHSVPGSLPAPSRSKDPSSVPRISSGMSVAPRATPPSHIPSPYGINGSPSNSLSAGRAPHIMPPAKRPGDPVNYDNAKLPRRSHSPQRSSTSSRQLLESHYALHPDAKSMYGSRDPSAEQNRGLLRASVPTEYENAYGREAIDRRHIERKDISSEWKESIARRNSRDPSLERVDINSDSRERSAERRDLSNDRRDLSAEKYNMSGLIDPKYYHAKPHVDMYDAYRAAAWVNPSEQSKTNSSSKTKYPTSVPTTLPQHDPRVPHAQPPHPYSYARPHESALPHAISHPPSHPHAHTMHPAQSKLYPPHAQSRGPPVTSATSHPSSQSVPSVSQSYPYPYPSQAAHYQQLQRQQQQQQHRAAAAAAAQYPPFNLPQPTKSASSSLAPPHPTHPTHPSYPYSSRTDPSLTLYPSKQRSQGSPHPAISPHHSVSPHPSASPHLSASPHSSSPHPLAASPRPGVSPHPSQGRTPQSSPHPAHRLPTSSPVQLSSHGYPGSLPPSPYQTYPSHSTPPSRPPSATGPPHTPSPHHSKSPAAAHTLQPPSTHPPPLSYHSRPVDHLAQDPQSHALNSISTLRQLASYSSQIQPSGSSVHPQLSRSQPPPLSQSGPPTSTPSSHPVTSQSPKVSQPPSVSQSQPCVSQSQPSISQSQPSVSQPQPSVSQSQPSVSQPQPSVSQPQPSVSQSQPTSQSQPSVSQSQPTSQSQPSISQSQPSVSQSPTHQSQSSTDSSSDSSAPARPTPDTGQGGSGAPPTSVPVSTSQVSSDSKITSQGPPPTVSSPHSTSASSSVQVTTTYTTLAPTPSTQASNSLSTSQAETRQSHSDHDAKSLQAKTPPVSQTPISSQNGVPQSVPPKTLPPHSLPNMTQAAAPHPPSTYPSSHYSQTPTSSTRVSTHPSSAYSVQAPPTTYASSPYGPYSHHQYVSSHSTHSSSRPPTQSHLPHGYPPQSYHPSRHGTYPHSSSAAISSHGPTQPTASSYTHPNYPYNPPSHSMHSPYAPPHSTSTQPRSVPNSTHGPPHSGQTAPHITVAPSQVPHAPSHSTNALSQSAHVPPHSLASSQTSNSHSSYSHVPPHTAHASANSAYPQHSSTSPRTPNAHSSHGVPHSSHPSSHPGHPHPHTTHAQSHAGYPPPHPLHGHHPSYPGHPSQPSGYPPHPSRSASHPSQVPPHPSYPSHPSHPSQALHPSQVHPYPGQTPSSSSYPHPSHSLAHPYSQSYPHPYPYSHSQTSSHPSVRPTQAPSQPTQVSPRSAQPTSHPHQSSHQYPHHSQTYPHPSHPYPHPSQSQAPTAPSSSRPHAPQPPPPKSHPPPTAASAPRPSHPSRGYFHPPTTQSHTSSHPLHRPPHPTHPQHPHYQPRFPHPTKTEDPAGGSQYLYGYPPQYPTTRPDAPAARGHSEAITVKQPEYPSPNSKTPDSDQSRIRTKGEQKSFDPRSSMGGSVGVKPESWPSVPHSNSQSVPQHQQNTSEIRDATKAPTQPQTMPETQAIRVNSEVENNEESVKADPTTSKPMEPGKAALVEKLLQKKLQQAETDAGVVKKETTPQESTEVKKEEENEEDQEDKEWDSGFSKLLDDLEANPEGVTSKKSKTLGRRYLLKVQLQEAIDNELVAPPPSYIIEEEESDSEPEAPVKFRGKFKSIKDKKVERLILTYASHSDESATEMIPDDDASDFEEELKRQIRSKDKKRANLKKSSKTYDSSGSDSGKKEQAVRKGVGKGRNKENKPNNKQDTEYSYSSSSSRSSSSSSSSSSDSSDNSDSSDDSDSAESEPEVRSRRSGKNRRKWESESSDSEEEVIPRRRTRRGYKSSSEEETSKKRQKAKKRKKKFDSSDSDEKPLKTRRGKRKKLDSDDEEETLTRRGKKKTLMKKKQQKRRKHDISDDESDAEEVVKTRRKKLKSPELKKKGGRKKNVCSDTSSSESEEVSTRRGKRDLNKKKKGGKTKLKKPIDDSSDNSDIPTKKKSPVKSNRVIDSDDSEDMKRKSDDEEEKMEDKETAKKVEVKDTLNKQDIKKEIIEDEEKEEEETPVVQKEEIGELEEEEDDHGNDSVIEKLNRTKEEEQNREDVKEMKAWIKEVSSDMREQVVNLPTLRNCWKKPQFGAGDDFLHGWQSEVKNYKEVTARFPKKLCQATKHQVVSPPGKGSPKKGKSESGKDSPVRTGSSSPAKNTRSKSGIIKTSITVAEDEKLKVAARPEISSVMQRFFEKVLADGGNDCTKGGLAAKKFGLGPYSAFGTQRTPTGLTPTPSVAPSMMASDDSDLDSLASLRTDLPASDSIPVSKRSIASSLLKKIGRKYNDKRLNSLCLNKSRSILEANNKPQLLPTPGIPTTEEDLKDMSPDQMKIATFFRKETVSNYRDNFEVIVTKNGINEFTPILYKSRTRKKTKQIQDAATVKSVFGLDLPPHLIKKVEESKRKKQLKKVEKKEDTNKSLLREESSPLPVSRASTPAGSVLAPGEDDDDSELRSERSESVLGESSAPTTAKKVRRKIRKFRSGFDYIRKKKKVKPEDEATPSRRRIPVRKHVNWPEQSRDVVSEVRTWVVNKGLGETVLHKAARLQYHDVVVYCAESPDFDINVRDNAGYTPLHEACNRGHLDIAQVLLVHGAHVNAPGYKGMRPLHEAVENGHGELARLLLAYGADPALTTYAGQTCLALCADIHTTRLIEGYLADLKGRHDETWTFNGPSRFFDPDEQGCDVFKHTPEGNVSIIDRPIKTEDQTDNTELEKVVSSSLKLEQESPQSNEGIQELSEKVNLTEEKNNMKVKIKEEVLSDVEDMDKVDDKKEENTKNADTGKLEEDNEEAAILSMKEAVLISSERPPLDIYQVDGRPHQYYLMSELLTNLSMTQTELVVAAKTIETVELDTDEFESHAHSCILGSCSRTFIKGQSSRMLVRITPEVDGLLGIENITI